MGKSNCQNYIEQRVLEIANYTIDNNGTVRDAAKHFGVSKTTVHRDLRKRLPKINNDLYKKVNKVLCTNLEERHIRGGNATKKIFANIKEGA